MSLSEIMSGDGEGLTKDHQKYLAMIGSSSKTMVEQIEEILDLEKFRQNFVKPNFGVCNLDEISERILQRFRPSAENKSLRIVNKIKKNTLVCSDDRLFSEVLSNLVSNAIKFTPSGGSVVLEVERSKDQTQSLVVSDTGIGMDSSTLGRVFEYTAMPSTKGTQGEIGSGMGLSICREVMLFLGGDLKASSNPNQGSRFEVQFPPFLCQGAAASNCQSCPVNGPGV